MRLFISYSTGDLAIVKQIADSLRPHAEVYHWDRDQVPGEEAWGTIFGWISISDLVVAVITDKTVSRAMSVGQEIGHAKALGKTVIPLIAEGVKESDLGCLQGITHIRVTPNNLAEVISEIEERIGITKRSHDGQRKLLYAILALLGLSLLFGGSDEDEEFWR